jgi:hypothetical protein
VVDVQAVNGVDDDTGGSETDEEEEEEEEEEPSEEEEEVDENDNGNGNDSTLKTKQDQQGRGISNGNSTTVGHATTSGGVDHRRSGTCYFANNVYSGMFITIIIFLGTSQPLLFLSLSIN